jgi:Kdo2-lipid IVA lauroyltransferase/acyltransferase
MTWLITILVKFFSWVVISLPRGAQVFFGRALGWTWFHLVPIRRKVALENIARAFPHWEERKRRHMGAKNFENYGCGLVEFMMLPHFDTDRAEKLFVVENFHLYQEAMAKNKGLFVLTLHIGSWELMSAIGPLLNIPLHVITKKFKAKGLNKVWIDLRNKRGIKLIEEEKSTFQILKAIRHGEVVGFILDQFMGPPVGVRTKFFGHETGTAAALALFADRTRAPVMPVYNVRQKDGKIRLIFEPEIPFMEQGGTAENIAFMTQVYTSKIEEIVKKYPEQWLWIHRRWKPFRD